MISTLGLAMVVAYHGVEPVDLPVEAEDRLFEAVLAFFAGRLEQATERWGKP